MIRYWFVAIPAGLAFITSILLGAGCSGGGATETAHAGGLRLVTSPVLTFDPARATDVPSVAAICKVYEAPLQFAYDDGPYRVIPCLAESMPVFSADNLTCELTFRSDARFQDDPCFTATGGRGRPVDATDFVYSLKRIADARVVSPGFAFFRGRIAGIDTFHAKTSTLAPSQDYPDVEGIVAQGRTVRITLTSPYPQLVWILAMSYAAVVPREAVEFYGDAFQRHPVGTGPYVLTSWRRNYGLTYAASDGWHGGRPPVESIGQFIVADPTTRWLSFMRAELDVCPDIPRDSWDAVMRPDGTMRPEIASLGIKAASAPSLTTAYIGINMDDPLLGNNAALRRALNAMIDCEAWTRFYNGRILPAAGPIPPGIAGGRKAGDKSAPRGTASAARLLAEAGFPNGIDPSSGRRIQLQLELGRTDTETRESTELLVAFAERIGVVLVPNYNTQSAFFRKIERRQAQLFRVGWVADYPDAENFLQLFYSPNASPGPNRANYRNPRFDALYERVRSMPDTPERTAIYEEMSAMVESDCPWVFLHYPLEHVLYHPWVENYRPHAFSYGMEKHYRVTSGRSTKGGSHR
jgi:ABC-type transport system substrate-binding protein